MRIELEKRANPSAFFSLLSPFLALGLTVSVGYSVTMWQARRLGFKV